MVLTSNAKYVVPTADSANNNDLRDVVGSKSDSHAGNSLYAKSEVLEEHIHSISKVYPTGEAGVTVTASATAWTLGSFAEIIPASTVGESFDIHFIDVEGISADATYELALYGGETEIGRIRFTAATIANATFFTSFPCQTPLLAANTQIQAKLMSSTAVADTMTISLFYHEY